jgi:two-component system, OmpR family, response regulator
MSMKILLIEDELKIADFVLQGFSQHGFVTEHFTQGNIGLQAALSGAFDVIVLDLMLPGMDGIDVLKRIRQVGISTPVIVLTAKGDLNDRLVGFEAGANDYLPKPFYVEELIARVRALLSRQSGDTELTTLSVGALSLDRISRRVQWREHSMVLSQREFTLLEYLMRSPGHIFTRKQILKHVWAIEFDPQTNVVDVCIQRIKKKLTSADASSISSFPIESIRGVGYKLRQDDAIF